MAVRIDLQPAYVLHAQPYQNTSLLVDFFCLDHGRMRAVAKGARRPTSRIRSLLQPFQPLLISLIGRSDLKTLSQVEGSVNAFNLQGTRLFSGLYLNELLARLLQSHESHPALYDAYQQAMIALHGERDLNVILRQFELDLLNELGYGLNLETDSNTGFPIDAHARYLFHPAVGFERLADSTGSLLQHAAVFTGREIRALKDLDITDKMLSNATRRLTRMALQPHLGEAPLMSRELFSRPPHQ
ncbi:MAG: DNA repair protein RecO [Pseudomonadota bacterium]